MSRHKHIVAKFNGQRMVLEKQKADVTRDHEAAKRRLGRQYAGTSVCLYRTQLLASIERRLGEVETVLYGVL